MTNFTEKILLHAPFYKLPNPTLLRSFIIAILLARAAADNNMSPFAEIAVVEAEHDRQRADTGNGASL